MDSKLDPNTYEKKLQLLKTARSNQLESETRMVKMLTDVRQDLWKVDDLLRPWIE